MSENSSNQSKTTEIVQTSIRSSLKETRLALRDLLHAGQDLGSASLSLIQEGWAERSREVLVETPPEQEPPAPEPPTAESETLNITETISSGISSTVAFATRLMDKAAEYLDSALLNEECRPRWGRRLYFKFTAEKETEEISAVNIDKVLHVMLTEVTATYGLRYNRAALFFQEPDQWCLTGRMAIGHVSHQEALKDWEQDHLQKRDNFERYLTLLEENMLPRTPLEVRIRNLRLPLGSAEDDLFSQVMLNGTSLLVEPDSLSRLPKLFLSVFAPTSSLAVIPIKPRNRVIGLLVVDNKFMEAPLTIMDIEVLNTYVETELFVIDERSLYHSRPVRSGPTIPIDDGPFEDDGEETFRHSDLIRIIGIGDEYERRLFGAGIHSQAELLEAASTRRGRKETAEIANINHSLILTWANHIDLCRIPGIDEEMAYLLELTGVDTIPEMAQRNPHNLHKDLTEIIISQKKKERPSVEEVARWVMVAEGLPRILQY